MAANFLKNDPSFVKMVILTADHKKAPLTEPEANRIEKHIFHQIYPSGGKVPRFRGKYVFSEDDGAIIIDTHVDSVYWLKNVIGYYKEKALRITDIKNSPQYTTKVAVDVTRLCLRAADNLVALLEAHNVGLQTDGWRLSSITSVIGLLVRSVTFLVDDPGMKMLEENGFQLTVGFSILTFTLLGRVKRSETTGEICKDVV